MSEYLYHPEDVKRKHVNYKQIAFDIGEGLLCIILSPILLTVAVGKILYDSCIGGRTH